jgi:predicted RNA polymerase sigma factor
VTGLLALMLLTDARRPARTGPDGALVPMDEQDRTRWDAGLIAEGVALVGDALPRGETGPYQVQAAIAAVHDEAPSSAETDWPQIVALYEVLLRLSANPVAVAMRDGPAAGLDLIAGQGDKLDADHRLHAVRAHLHAMAGDHAAARAGFEATAERTMSLPQQRYLHRRARASGECQNR